MKCFPHENSYNNKKRKAWEGQRSPATNYLYGAKPKKGGNLSLLSLSAQKNLSIALHNTRCHRGHSHLTEQGRYWADTKKQAAGYKGTRTLGGVEGTKTYVKRKPFVKVNFYYFANQHNKPCIKANKAQVISNQGSDNVQNANPPCTA